MNGEIKNKKTQNNLILEKRCRDLYLNMLENSGTQTRLAELTKIDQGRLAKLLSGKTKFGNLTLDSACKLFPGLMDFFIADSKLRRPLIQKIHAIIEQLDEEQATNLLIHLASNYKIKSPPEKSRDA